MAGPTVTQEASVTFRREKSAHAQGQHPMETRPTNIPEAAGRLPVLAQAVAAPLTRAAIFLVATLNPGPENRAILRSFCGDLAALVRAVEFRDLEGGLSCVMGFGSDAWNRLFGPPHPPGGSGAAVSGHTTPPSSPAVSCAPGTNSPAHTSQTAGSHSLQCPGIVLSQTQTSVSSPQTHARLSSAPSPSCYSSRAPLHPPDPYNGSVGR